MLFSLSCPPAELPEYQLTVFPENDKETLYWYEYDLSIIVAAVDMFLKNTATQVALLLPELSTKFTVPKITAFGTKLVVIMFLWFIPNCPLPTYEPISIEQFPLLFNVELIDEISESIDVFNVARIVPSVSLVPASSVDRCSCVIFSDSSACPMSSRLLAFTGGGLDYPTQDLCTAYLYNS